MWWFISPTKGRVTLSDVADDIVEEVRSHPQDDYRLMVGSDSQLKENRQRANFVSAIILHRVGKGGRYYVHRETAHHPFSLRQRMFAEAGYSLQLGGMLSEALQERGNPMQLQVHLDIGEKGATNQMIREIVAWITASGYEARIKPDSFGASKVADRYTRN